MNRSCGAVEGNFFGTSNDAILLNVFLEGITDAFTTHSYSKKEQDFRKKTVAAKRKIR